MYAIPYRVTLQFLGIFNDDVVIEMQKKNRKKKPTEILESITPYSDYKSRMYSHITYGLLGWLLQRIEMV